jgi:hypothetical protein
MLDLIPAYNENKKYVNYPCPFFIFTQWTQWGTVMIHQHFSHRMYSLNTVRRLVIASKSMNLFFDYCAKRPLQNSGGSERFKQVDRHYLILDSDQILLSFLFRFSFVILTHTPIYCCEVGHTVHKQSAQTRIPLIRVEMWDSFRQVAAFNSGRNVRQLPTSCCLLCIISLLHAVHTWSG